MELFKESPHIVNLLESFKQDNVVYLITKFAEGGDLLQCCVTRQSLSEECVRHIFTQISMGVHDLHQAGLVHRDLKFNNIFMCDRSEMPRVMIGDLGSAAFLKTG